MSTFGVIRDLKERLNYISSMFTRAPFIDRSNGRLRVTVDSFSGGTNTLEVVGDIAQGTAIGTSNPVKVGGSDRVLVRDMVVTPNNELSVAGNGESITYFTVGTGAASVTDGTNGKTIVIPSNKEADVYIEFNQISSSPTIQLEYSHDNLTWTIIPMTRIDTTAASLQYAAQAAFTPVLSATWRGKVYGAPYLRVHLTAGTTTSTIGYVRVVPLPDAGNITLSPFWLNTVNTTEAVGVANGAIPSSAGVRTLVNKNSTKALLVVDGSSGTTNTNTLVLEGSNDGGATYTALPIQPVAGGAQVTSVSFTSAAATPAGGVWEADVSQYQLVRVRMTAAMTTSPAVWGCLKLFATQRKDIQITGGAGGQNLDAFGRLRTSFPQSLLGSKQIYDTQPLDFDDVQVSGTASSTYNANNSSTILSTSAAIGRRVRQSKKRFNYQPGKAQLIYKTFTFGTGVANAIKNDGYFDDANGIFVQQNGTTLNIVKRSSAYRTFTATWTRSTTTATITTVNPHGLTTGQFVAITVTSDAAAIPLSSTTVASSVVTVTGTTTFTITCLNAGGASGTLSYDPYRMFTTAGARASNIYTFNITAHGLTSGQMINVTATGDAGSLTTGWYYITVVNANSFTVVTPVSSGATSALTATFTPARDQIVASTAWNYDKFDGSGPSGITLDATKSLIFFIDFEWLGVGTIYTGFVINGAMYTAHVFQNSNLNAGVYMQTPNLPVRSELIALTAVTALHESICAGVMSEGGADELGKQFGTDVGITGLQTANNTSIYPILAIQYQTGKTGAQIDLLDVAILSTATATTYFKWSVVLNPTITNGPMTFSSITNSVLQSGVSPGNTTTVTGGTVLASGYSAGGGASQYRYEFKNLKNVLGSTYAGTSDILYVCVQNLVNGTNTYLPSLTWKETV